jgi:hypothetical protein
LLFERRRYLCQILDLLRKEAVLLKRSFRKRSILPTDLMNQQLTPQVEQWLSIRDEHIRQLQEDLSVATAAYKAAQENVRDLAKFKQEYLVLVNKFQQEANAAILDNQALRKEADEKNAVLQSLESDFLVLQTKIEQLQQAEQTQKADTERLYAQLANYDQSVLDMEQKAKQAQADLAAATAREAALNEALAKSNVDLDAIKAAVTAQETALDEALAHKNAELDAAKAAVTARETALNEALAKNNAELDAIKAAATERETALNEALAQNNTALDTAQAALTRKVSELEEASAQLAQLRALIADKDQQQAQILSRLTAFETENTLTTEHETAERLAQTDRFEADIAGLKRELEQERAASNQAIAQYHAETERLQTELEGVYAGQTAAEKEQSIHLAKISALENALTEVANERTQLQQRLQLAQSTTREVDAVRQEHVAYVGAFQQKTTLLEQEVQQWQHDYEQLRIQKGGFGFKAMAAAGFAATIIGIGVGFLVFRQRDPNALLFQKFSQAAGFNLEYSLTHGQYDKADKIIQDFSKNSTFAPILPEISFVGNLLEAAKLRGDSAVQPNLGGYSVLRYDTISGERPKPVRSLVIIHDGAVNVHTEALYNAPVLITLKKRDKIDQWDRTAELTKLKTVNAKGKKGVAEDYWYEVETADGQKGWVFGFFTNASINRFKPDVPDSIPPAPVVVDTASRN